MWVCGVVLGVFQASERAVNSDKFRNNWWTLFLWEQHLGAGKQVNKQKKTTTQTSNLSSHSLRSLFLTSLHAGTIVLPFQRWYVQDTFLYYESSCFKSQRKQLSGNIITFSYATMPAWCQSTKDCSLFLNIQHWQVKISILNHPSQCSLLQLINLGCTFKFYSPPIFLPSMAHAFFLFSR